MDDFTFSSILKVVKRFFLIPTLFILLIHFTAFKSEPFHKISVNVNYNNICIVDSGYTDIISLCTKKIQRPYIYTGINNIEIYNNQTDIMIT